MNKSFKRKVKVLPPLVINGITILDASGGGGVLIINLTTGKEMWIGADHAHRLFGEAYGNNKRLGNMISRDYDNAMRKAVRWHLNNPTK